MAITKKEVDHVSRLARLALTDEEKENFTLQLGKILEYVEKLREPSTTQVLPTAHPFGRAQGTPMREDKTTPWPNPEAILANAPEREENFFKVKKVIE